MITLDLTTTLNATISEEQAKRITLEYVWLQMSKLLGGEFPDDAGYDWYTLNGSTYIANEPEWLVSCNEELANWVNVMNIIRYGRVLILGED